MTKDKIPSVLYQPNGNSLSVERVIKQAMRLLEFAKISPDKEDLLINCVEDLNTLLAHIDRS